MKKNHLFLKVIILFIFLILFSTPSLALIPGDFGSAGGGPPDGVVDFEDLMIFALAYGSIPVDTNWNPDCDIYPDGIIDFEDLMIFAMNYGQREIVADVSAFAYTYQSSMNEPKDKLSQLVKEDKIPDSYCLNELPPFQKGIAGHSINVYWHSFPEATGYRIYRNANGSDFTVEDLQPSSVSDWYSIWDYDVTEGGIYCYYVTAYGLDWETDPSQIVIISTWLPPCSLVSPADKFIVSDPNPTFTWNPVGISSLPYGAICSGDSIFQVEDDTAGEEAWWRNFYDNLTISTITYDDDGQAVPLVADHSYYWHYGALGYDENDNMIAVSVSEDWGFEYTGVEDIATKITVANEYIDSFTGVTYVKGLDTVIVTFPESVGSDYIVEVAQKVWTAGVITYVHKVVTTPNADRKVWVATYDFTITVDNDCEAICLVALVKHPCCPGEEVALRVVTVDYTEPYADLFVTVKDCDDLMVPGTYFEWTSSTTSNDITFDCCGDDCSGFAYWNIVVDPDPYLGPCDCVTGTTCPVEGIINCGCIAYADIETNNVEHTIIFTLVDNVGNADESTWILTFDTDSLVSFTVENIPIMSFDGVYQVLDGGCE